MVAFSSSASRGASRFQEAIHALIPRLGPAEARTAQYLALHESELGFETGASIARKAGVSEITVSRLLRRLGYRGMAGLKAALQSEAAAGALGADVQARRLFDGDYGAALREEAQALLALAQQFEGPVWPRLVERVAGAGRVYATGFQTVRGAAEDFARRLSLVRPDVRFVAAHDGALTEWIARAAGPEGEELLVLIDVVPYAREAQALAELCAERGVGLVVFTDEFNSWASAHTELAIRVKTRNGLFLESTGTLTTALNVLVHAVAQREPEAAERRMADWRRLAEAIDLF
jgi:DNA-binding MurR/RpiR family transcriptional regulator